MRRSARPAAARPTVSPASANGRVALVPGARGGAAFELGYLPLRNVLTLRGLTTLAARWRELIGYLPLFLAPARSLERVIDSKMPREA